MSDWKQEQARVSRVQKQLEKKHPNADVLHNEEGFGGDHPEHFHVLDDKEHFYTAHGKPATEHEIFGKTETSTANKASKKKTAAKGLLGASAGAGAYAASEAFRSHQAGKLVKLFKPPVGQKWGSMSLNGLAHDAAVSKQQNHALNSKIGAGVALGAAAGGAYYYRKVNGKTQRVHKGRTGSAHMHRSMMP